MQTYAHTGQSAESSRPSPAAATNRPSSTNLDGSCPTPSLAPRNSTQGTDHAPRRLSVSSVYRQIPINLANISPQQSPTSPNVSWPSPSDDPHHNLAFTPYLQMAYPPYPGAPSAFSQSPTTALPLDHANPQIPRWTLAGSLDPATGIFYRAPEHPRLRTAQACEKCRTRKAKCSGDHPTCHRCLTRGLTCRYAAEGRMRGPNKPKKRSDVNSSNGSQSTSRRNSVASTQSVKKHALEPAKPSPDTESHQRPILNTKRHSMPVLSTNLKECREKARPHSIHFGMGNTEYQGLVEHGEGEGSTIVTTEGLTGGQVHQASEMGTLFARPQPQLTHSNSMPSSFSGYDEASTLFHAVESGPMRHYTVDGRHATDFGGQALDFSMFHAASPLAIRTADGQSSSFTSSPVSGMPSPVTPSLPIGEEGDFNPALQNNQHTFAYLQDRAWVLHTDIHSFDHQHNGTEKNGWDNFCDSTEPLSLHHPEL